MVKFVENKWIPIGLIILVAVVLFALQIAILIIETRQLQDQCGRKDDSEKLTWSGEKYPIDTISVSMESLGRSSDDRELLGYMMTNNNGMSVQILNYGAAIRYIKVPDRNGNIVDITQGFDNAKDYEQKNNDYFGVIIGRVAGHIAGAKFTLNGVQYQLTTNSGEYHKHGGTVGWNKAVWKSTELPGGVMMSHISPDGDQGYPGEIKVNVTYILTDDNQLIVRMTAVNSLKATPINLASHPSFNLGGEGATDLADHQLMVNADNYLPTNDQQIPTGIESVNGTLFDLRSTVNLKQALSRFNTTAGEGFDHTYSVRGPTGKRLAARLEHTPSGRRMELYTNQLGVHVYTSNDLEATGKEGHKYGKYSSVSLSTQNYPNAINEQTFPDSVLRLGSTYEHWIWYQFSTM